MRRYFYLILAVVVVLVIGVGIIYFVFFNKTQPAPIVTGPAGTLPAATGTQTGTTGIQTGTTGNLPSGGNATGTPGAATRFGVVSNEPVFAYSVDTQNNVVVVEPDGEIARITDGQPTFLSSSKIDNLISAGFSHDGTKALVNFGDPANPQTSVFDLAVKAWAPLAAGIISPTWSPNDHRIAYFKANANGTETLTTLDVSKTTNKPNALISLNIKDLSLAWPNKNLIVMGDKPSAYAQGSVWLFDLQKKTLTSPVENGLGLEAIWSNTTSSAGLIFESGAGGFGGTLSFLGAPTNSVKDLAFLTLPSKCTFNYEVASTTPPYLALYCAMPQDTNKMAGAHLPDEYEQGVFFTADNFYKIHTDTGATENFFLPTTILDATKLTIVNNVLFFVNRYDQKLYAISAG